MARAVLPHGMACGVAVKVQGDIAMRQGDLVAARAYYEESLPMLRDGEGLPAVASVMGLLGGIDLINGDFAAARVRLADSAQLDRDLGTEIDYHIHRTYEGIAALFQGDYVTAGNLLVALFGIGLSKMESLHFWPACLLGLIFTGGVYIPLAILFVR